MFQDRMVRPESKKINLTLLPLKTIFSLHQSHKERKTNRTQKVSFFLLFPP